MKKLGILAMLVALFGVQVGCQPAAEKADPAAGGSETGGEEPAADTGDADADADAGEE